MPSALFPSIWVSDTASPPFLFGIDTCVVGPNTLTFIIPAEIFPTRYRCTCHGIAAAAGKLGSVVVQAILPAIRFNGVKVSDPNSDGLGWVFIIFGFVMALGALFAWTWIPSLQHNRDGRSLKLPSKTLEELGAGLVKARASGEMIGMRDKLGGALGRMWPF